MEKNTAVRKKKKYSSPNPLFERWLTEWKEEAAGKGLKTQYVYAKALASLKKYPLPLSSGKDAKILEYFGDKICTMLDAKLLEIRKSTSSSSDSVPSVEDETTGSLSSSQPTACTATKTVSKSPRKTSANVKTVNLGRIAYLPKPSMTPIDLDEDLDEFSSVEKSFHLFPNTYRIVLCVDNCETFSGQGKHKQQFLSELEKHGVAFNVRKLHVGDFLWIAQEVSGERRELVLDFVVERKRLDDLAKSIKDGRFREQKVIDGFIIKQTNSIKESASYLSMMTKMLQNKFQNETLLSSSKENLRKKNIPYNMFMTFKEFNTASMKNKSLTVKEMFAKHLLQFFGLSVERAAALVDTYDTPAKLLEAYDSCLTEEEREKMVSSIKFGIQKKNIGPALSKSLHQYYCTEFPPK